MRPGDIFLWSGTNIVALGIQKVTKSRWSHVGWVLDDDHFIDSYIGGIKVRPSAEYFEQPARLEIVSICDCEETRDRLLDEARKYIGKGYDFMMVASLFFAIMKGKSQCADIREWPEAFSCSEFVAQVCFNVLGMRFGCHVEETTPGDIARHFGVE